MILTRAQRAGKFSKDFWGFKHVSDACRRVLGRQGCFPCRPPTKKSAKSIVKEHDALLHDGDVNRPVLRRPARLQLLRQELELRVLEPLVSGTHNTSIRRRQQIKANLHPLFVLICGQLERQPSLCGQPICSEQRRHESSLTPFCDVHCQRPHARKYLSGSRAELLRARSAYHTV